MRNAGDDPSEPVFSTTLSQPRPAPTRAENAIGEAEMRQLRREFSETEVREVAQMFREEGAVLLEQLETAAAGGEAETLRRVAHALRGAGANFGARRLDALCQEIEVNARTEGSVGADDLVRQVREEYGRVERALQRECEGICHE